MGTAKQLVIGAGIAAAIATLVIGSRRLQTTRRPGEAGMEGPGEVAFYDRNIKLVHFISRLNVIPRLAGLAVGGLLLDAGCGPGYLLNDIEKTYPDLKTIGLDISAEMLRAARKNLAAQGAEETTTLVLGDVQSLPFADDSLDCVVSTFSLHHWSEAERGIGEVHRVLTPGGRFVLFDLRRDSPRLFYWGGRAAEWAIIPGSLKEIDGVVSSALASYTPGEMKDLVEHAGFGRCMVETGPAWSVVTAVK